MNVLVVDEGEESLDLMTDTLRREGDGVLGLSPVGHLAPRGATRDRDRRQARRLWSRRALPRAPCRPRPHGPALMRRRATCPE